MGFNGGSMGFWGGLMGFYGGLMGINGGLMAFKGNFNGIWLVVAANPSEKCEFVSWDDEIPN